MWQRNEWVRSRLDNKVGWVDGETKVGVAVNWVVDGKVHKANASAHHLIKLESKLNNEDLNQLIEMSLLTKDEDWFFALIGRSKQQGKREIAE